MNLADAPVRLERAAGWLDLDGYRPEYARQAGRLAAVGFGVNEVAAFFEVDGARLEAWRERHPEFARALDGGAVRADAAVAAALYRAAVGHERTETRTVGGRAVACTVHVPADVRACMYWLERRCPERWAARPAVRADTGPSSVLLATG